MSTISSFIYVFQVLVGTILEFADKNRTVEVYELPEELANAISRFSSSSAINSNCFQLVDGSHSTTGPYPKY